MNQKFKNMIESNSEDKPTLIYFKTEGCPACKKLKPHLKDFKDKYDLDMLELDVSDYRDLTSKLKIMGLPTTLLYKEGEIKGRFSGFKPKKHLSDWLSSNLKRGLN